MNVPIRLISELRPTKDVEDIADHLQSTALGVYDRTHCLITLRRDASFWHPENEPTVGRLSVFLHEYLHFVHNFSTVTGIYDFFAQLRFLRLFCNTVDRAGKSHGGDVLELDAREEVKNVVTWLRHLRGGVRGGGLISDAINREASHPQFKKWEPTSYNMQIGPQSNSYHGILIEFDGESRGLQHPIEIELGSFALMESCALEAECLLVERFDGIANDIRQRVPPYPYLTARCVFEGIAQFSPSSWLLCRLCVLALQSTDPGNAFIQLSLACKNSGTDQDERTLIDKFLSDSRDLFQNSVRKILDDSLAKEATSFYSRGRAGRGIQRMVAWAETLFSARLQDPFFELTVLDSLPDTGPLVSLWREMPVCPIVQEIDFSTNENALLFFMDGAAPLEVAEEICAAQSLLHLSRSHLTSEGILVCTAKLKNRPCIFYGACRATLATQGSEICQARPWDSFDPSSTQGCWYSQGVAAARGRPDL